MNYHVIWSGLAVRQLADIWVAAQQPNLQGLSATLRRLVARELRALTAASRAIDHTLQRNPLTMGRPHRRSLTRRILAVGPLEVGYEVDPQRM